MIKSICLILLRPISKSITNKNCPVPFTSAPGCSIYLRPSVQVSKYLYLSFNGNWLQITYPFKQRNTSCWSMCLPVMTIVIFPFDTQSCYVRLIHCFRYLEDIYFLLSGKILPQIIQHCCLSPRMPCFTRMSVLLILKRKHNFCLIFKQLVCTVFFKISIQYQSWDSLVVKCSIGPKKRKGLASRLPARIIWASYWPLRTRWTIEVL